MPRETTPAPDGAARSPTVCDPTGRRLCDFWRGPRCGLPPNHDATAPGTDRFPDDLSVGCQRDSEVPLYLKR